MLWKRQFASSKRIHTALAVAFLLVMLIEWGSHNLAFAHAEPSQGLVTVLGSDVEHEDLCRTMVCCEGRKQEQTTPSSFHEVSPNAPIVERADERLRPDRARNIPLLPREDAHGIFRPKNPLFHPPEFS